MTPEEYDKLTPFEKAVHMDVYGSRQELIEMRKLLAAILKAAQGE